MKIVERL